MKEKLGLALTGLLLAGCATATSGADALVGTPVPKMNVSGLDGRALNTRALDGKVVLVDIWASYCDPCKEELPLLEELAARLRPKGVMVLAVSVDEERANAVGFLKAHGASWTSLAFAHDPGGQFAERLKVPKMPSSYIVDREGIIRQVNSGYERADVAKIEARLVELSGQP
jgi:cytochrome c biogenesis protein CcmG, thiol:disulfide interchange protein DsbE